MIEKGKKNITCSVVMPVHNGEKFLREAIEGVLNQTYKKFEFLIIENCSIDSSIEIIKSYSDPRIRIVFESECGQVFAYNRGFKEAKGEFIFIHDQDDVSANNRFEIQLRTMIELGSDICGTSIGFLDHKGNFKSSSMLESENSKITRRIIYDCSILHNPTVCIKKKVLETLHYWNHDMYPIADVEFYLRARKRYTFNNIPQALYFWRKHEKQLSIKNIKKSKTRIKEIELSYLVSNKAEFSNKEYYFLKSMIYYYSDYLISALCYLMVSIRFGKFDKENIRYTFIIIILGPMLKVFRKLEITHSFLFTATRNAVNRVFN